MIKTQTKNNFKKMKFIFLASLGFTLLSLVFVKTIHALTLTVIPPQIEIEVTPGETVVKTLKIRNDSTETQVLKAIAKDFIVTDNSGTPVIIEKDVEHNRWAASAWIQVSPSQIKLEPGQLRGIQLIINTPKNATPGGHYAAVLYSPDQSNIVNQAGSAIDPRTGTLVYIKVPGDIKQDAKVTKFKVPSFQEYGPVNILSTITNLSDIHITPIGKISIKSWLGKKIADLNLDQTNIFPYTSRDFENILNKKWLFGRYQAQLNAGYGTTGQALVATAYFWVIPWKLITALLIIVVLAITITKLLKNKKSKKDDQPLGQPSQELKKKYQDKK
jgi:hypothetical protein